MATAVNTRATPNASFNPSQPQISAPVREYRCMFTHDIRKKAKKWHDGSLRFHTFNKRVMVYDDTKNLVGGLHYRSSDDFAEGLELNLDTHVLVQVEEQLGESSTDLTSLLGRQKQDGPDQFAKPNPPTRAALPRINAVNSQIKPKSIKELLASSQGTIGRARLPNTSPYEQRYALVESQPGEPGSKKRKTAHGKENDAGATALVRPKSTYDGPSLDPSPRRQTDVVDVSSDDDANSPAQKRRKTTVTKRDLNHPIQPASPPTAAARTTQRVLARPTRSGSEERRARLENDISRIHNPRERNLKQMQKPRKEKEVDATTPRPIPASPVVRTTIPCPSSVQYYTGPRSSLKFTDRKPRPKLMYRALLKEISKAESDTAEASYTATATCETTLSRGGADEETVRRPRHTNLLDTDNLFAASQVAKTTDVDPFGDPDGGLFLETSTTRRLQDSSAAATCAKTSTPEEEVTVAVPDSPLFLPRTTSQISPLRSHEAVVDDVHLRFLSQEISRSTRLRSIPNVASRSTSLSSACSLQDAVADCSSEHSSSPVFQRLGSEGSQPAKSASSPVFQDRQVCRDPPLDLSHAESPPFQLPAASAMNGRLFRRVVSESIPTSHDVSDMSPRNGDDKDLDSSTSSDILDQSRTYRKKASVLPQCLSDPVDSNLAATPPFLVPSSFEADDCSPRPVTDQPPAKVSLPEAERASVPESTNEAGPWTSTEAFLLFDWWPSGRQKPPCSKNLSAAAGLANSKNSSNTNTSERSGNPSLRKKYGTFGSAKFVSQR